jgi:hypothetical protein
MKKNQAEIVDDSLVLEQEPQTEQVESSSDQIAQPESRELTEVEKLINKRTGFWVLNIEEADLKWIRNHCNSKFTFTGPNEAFMLMNCYLGFSSAIARLEQMAKAGMEAEKPAVQAAAIEACAMLINRFEGSGIESAQRIFRIAIALNGTMTELKKLDDQIAILKAQEAEQE